MQLLEFAKNMQPQVIRFFELCFTDLGWSYSPGSRHINIADIEKYYMQNVTFIIWK